MIYDTKTGKEEWPELDTFFPVLVYTHGAKTQNTKCPIHWHDCLEVLYIVEGNPLVFVDGKQHTAQKNDIIFINGGVRHTTWFEPGSNDELVVMSFMPSLLYDANSYLFKLPYISEFLKPGTYKYINDTSRFSEKLYKIVTLALKEYRLMRYGYELEVMGCLEQLIAEIIRCEQETKDGDFSTEKDNRLFMALSYINAHYNENINLDHLAKLCNYNYCYFSKLFKQIIHVNVNEYINMIRVRETKKLLSFSNEKLCDISYRVGFGSVASFNRIFKEVCEMSPNEYRKKYK